MRSLPVTRPRLVVAVVALFTVVAVVFGAAGLGGLSTQGFEDPATQAHRAADRYAAATGIDSNLTAVVLVHPDGGVTGAADPRVLAARARLAAVPGVVSVTPPSVAGNRHSALLIAAFREGTSQGTDASALRAAFRGRTDVVVGGAVIANHDITSIIGQDIGRAEMVAFPVLFLVSLLVFRGVIAALMPVVVGMVAIMGGFLGLAMANHLTSVSVFATNLVIGLGLGLAVDYALLLVSRYREEVAVHGHTPDAVRATLRSAGRSVLFSAVTVAAAMAGLMLFPQDFLFSMGLGGLMVALVAALVAVSLVPAMLMLLGPRIDALSPRRWRDSLAQRHAAPHTGAWYRLSHLVMRRALPVTVAAAAVMLALGTPALGIRFTSIDEGVLPTSSPARVAHDMLRADFPDDAADPVRILARAPATPASGAALARYAATLGNLPGVASVSRPQPLRGGTWLIQAVLAQPPLSAASERAVRDIRRAAAPVPVLVGGRTATQIDEKASLARHLPLAAGVIALTTIAVLFLMTGSVVLALVSVLLNMLTLGATLGILTMGFQRGLLEGPLNFTSIGGVSTTQPILVAAFAFGLSTDYGVFLLSRIAEERSRGLAHREAVPVGLEHTGRIVTAAAVLFVIAIGAFASSRIVIIKELGVGTALAVLLDATIVRALLLPGLLAMLGERSWWSPRVLERLRHRLPVHDRAAAV